MDAFTLTQYLHDHIPLSKAMQVGVLSLNEDSVVLGAPLALVSTRKVLMKFEWVTETGEASKAHSPMSYRRRPVSTACMLAGAYQTTAPSPCGYRPSPV